MKSTEKLKRRFRDARRRQKSRKRRRRYREGRSLLIKQRVVILLTHPSVSMAASLLAVSQAGAARSRTWSSVTAKS
jgi:hypothetical protein